MSKIEVIENEITNLNKTEFKQFRSWFYDLDNNHWDNQIKEDVKEGKFNSLADIALKEFNNGTTSSL